MTLQLFNTLTRAVEPFAPRNPQRVGMYCCGPTVYDYAHIGNFRTFVLGDFLRRYLEFRGFGVFHVMNITDVEDKILRRVRETGTSLREYTGRFEAAFLEDAQALGCLRPHALPRATDHIPEILSLISTLLARGVAYQAADGSVYFSIDHYRASGRCYGQLLNLNFEAMRPGERVRNDEYEKESIADFALWKARTSEDGDVHWPSPWGDGRPGWHIECSAMSMKLLGPSFDLHLGGEDLIFPHHEDEIAQSEGAALQPPGARFVHHWVHGAHLLVQGRKMSKSLGNYYSVRDLLQRGFLGREIRYTLLTAHYRETFNFTLENLTGARSALARIDECLSKLQELSPENPSQPPQNALLERLTDALDDDLNVAAAWGVVFDWIRDLNRRLAAGQVSPNEAASALATWQRIDAVFGVGRLLTSEIPSEIQELLSGRELARKSRDYARADALRAELKQKGWLIEDTPKGPRLKPLT